MPEPESELDRIDPEPTTIKLVSGFPVEVVRLRTRQLFRLMRILTKGAGPAMQQMNFGGEGTEFAQQLLAIIVMAIPDAETETILFMQSMCRPAGLVDKSVAQMSKQDNETNQALLDRFGEELFNPELEDTLALLEAIVMNEAPDLQALGKKLQHLWTVGRKAFTGKDPEAEKMEETQLPDSPGLTPASSTSSATSTGGQTSTSSTSPSAGSGSARRQRSAGGKQSS